MYFSGFADLGLGFAGIGVFENPRLQNPGFRNPEVQASLGSRQNPGIQAYWLNMETTMCLGIIEPWKPGFCKRGFSKTPIPANPSPKSADPKIIFLRLRHVFPAFCVLA